MTFDEMLEFRHDSIIGSMRTALKYAEQYRGTNYAVMLDEKNGHPFVVDMSLADGMKSDGILLETFRLGQYEKLVVWSDDELDTALKNAAYEVKRNIGEYADFPEFNLRTHPRVESYAQLADVMSPTRYQKINSDEYSDITLSTLADFKAEYSAIIADSKFSPQTINKLCKAYLEDKISGDDLIMATKYSDNNTANERYVDDFLKSIDNGLYHETAAKVFAAVGYGDQTFNEAVSLVKSGAFYPTDYAGLSVSEDVAMALYELRYPLRACEGFNFCYDIDDGVRLQAALDRNSAIFVTDKSLALAVNELMAKPDWDEFRDYVNAELKSDISKLTDDWLAEMSLKWSENIMAAEKVNLDKSDEPIQESNAQFVEKDFGGEWQDGYDEPTEVELSADSDISVDIVSADDMDMSMDIIDLGSTKAIENAPPPIVEQQSSISETAPDTDNIFYKVDDLGDEHTDDSFSQSVKLHDEINRLERELAKANAKISSLQSIVDKTNAVINSDKQLLSDFRAAMKTYERTVGKAEKEKIPDQPKKASPPKHNRK